MKKLAIIALAGLAILGCKKKTENTDKPWENGTGDYAPYTLGSTFTFEVVSSAPASTDSTTMTVTRDTTMDGLTFKKLEPGKNIIPPFYFNYSSGVQKEAQINFQAFGAVVPKLLQTNLKVNEATGASWTEAITLNFPGIPIPINVNFVHQVMAKGISKTVLAKNYTDVIHMKTTGTLALPPGITPPAGIPTSITFESFYAKNTGLIERSGPNQTMRLKRFNVVR